MEEFAHEDVERALAMILADARFVAARRMSAFLAYVVRQALDGNGARIKAYTVGVEALEKAETFDPQGDPSVRVLAKRLRSALIDYHERNPHACPIIEIRCGSYCPVFVAPARDASKKRVRTPSNAAGSPCRGLGSMPSVHVLAMHRSGTLDAQLAAVIRSVLAQRCDIRVMSRDAGTPSSELAPGPEDYELRLEVLQLEHEQRVELQLLRIRDGQFLDGLTVRVAKDGEECPRPIGTVTRNALVAEIERFVGAVARPDNVLMSDYATRAPRSLHS